MQLVNDPLRLAALIAANAPPEIVAGTFDPAKWFAEPSHFALEAGGDLAMFEADGEWPGPLTAHVMFRSRGRAALDTARAMIERAFTYGATEILGETPANLRHAILFARLLGFVPYGEKETPMGTVVLSRLRPK